MSNTFPIFVAIVVQMVVLVFWLDQIVLAIDRQTDAIKKQVAK